MQLASSRGVERRPSRKARSRSESDQPLDTGRGRGGASPSRRRPPRGCPGPRWPVSKKVALAGGAADAYPYSAQDDKYSGPSQRIGRYYRQRLDEMSQAQLEQRRAQHLNELINELKEEVMGFGPGWLPEELERIPDAEPLKAGLMVQHIQACATIFNEAAKAERALALETARAQVRGRVAFAGLMQRLVRLAESDERPVLPTPT